MTGGRRPSRTASAGLGRRARAAPAPATRLPSALDTHRADPPPAPTQRRQNGRRLAGQEIGARHRAGQGAVRFNLALLRPTDELVAGNVVLLPVEFAVMTKNTSHSLSARARDLAA